MKIYIFYKARCVNVLNIEGCYNDLRSSAIQLNQLGCLSMTTFEYAFRQFLLTMHVFVDDFPQAPGNKHQISNLEIASSRFLHNSARLIREDPISSGGGTWGGALYLGDVPKVGILFNQFPGGET